MLEPENAATSGLSGVVGYASEYSTSGYSVAARRCVTALAGAGVDVRWHPLIDAPRIGRIPAASADGAPPELASLHAAAQPGETLVVHSVPRAWRVVKDELQPARMIGHTVWETDRLPQLWLRQMDLVDEFWVPTAWNQFVFEEAFRRPVHVIPHVVSTAVPEPPPMWIPDDRFVVAIVSAWDWRKRPDLAIEAFFRAFGPQDMVALVIKSNVFPVAWPHRQHIATVAHIAEIRERHWWGCPILVDTADWPEPQVLGLLRRADCFLSLSASEGWGLGAFDAACHGTPILISGYGGQVEWLGTDYPGLLPHRRVNATHPDETLFEPGMTWGEVDVDTAADALRQLYLGHLRDLTGRAESLAGELRTCYAPSVVADAAIGALPDEVRRLVAAEG